MRIGVYDIAAAEYHADPCPEPSLSSSVIKVLLDQSPRHAWMQHPRLNPSYEAEHSGKFDLGAAAHAMLLKSDDGICVIDAPDYRTNAAKSARAQAYEQNQIPVLTHQLDEVRRMVHACKAQLSHHEDDHVAFSDGRPEQTLIWQEGEIWCRARLDWLPHDPVDGTLFYDYKTTGTSANPETFARQFFDLGYHIQAEWYARGVQAVLGIRPHFRFVVQETKPPYAICVMSSDPAGEHAARLQVDEALSLWRWCMKHDAWPGYPRYHATVEIPAWYEARLAGRAVWIEKGLDLKTLMLDWQAPLETAE